MAITRDNTKIQTWFERDRAHVALLDASSEDVLIEWWDEAVQEAVDDGFLDARDWHGSAVDYANHLGIGCNCPALETGGKHSRNCPAGNPKRIGFGLVPEVEDAYLTGEEAAKRLIAAGRGKQENPHQLLLVENGKRWPRIRLEDGPIGGTFLLVRAGKKNINEDRDTVLIQTDWDYPGVAGAFGWSPCHPDTDGTIDCRKCGKTASDMIAEAGNYLAEHIGKVVEDPGYLPDLSENHGKKRCICRDKPNQACPVHGSHHDEDRHDVLCQCGWGRLQMPESQIPEHCPVCGDVLKRANGAVALWETPPPTEWVELHEDEDGYSFRTSTGEGDTLGRVTLAEAVKYIERKVINRRFERKHNPDDYSWECSQCGPGPVRRCDGCRKVARLAPLGVRRGGAFLPSEAALNRRKNGSAVLDESDPKVQKADRAFKQWHGGAESQHVDEWSGRTDGPDKVMVHSYCGHCPAVDFIHSGPECDECAEHTQVVEGKDVTFFGHRVEFSGGQMPKLYKYKAGSKVFISGGGVDRLRRKFGDRLGRCPVFEYVVDDIKDSDKHGNHWVHTARKPYGVWEWDDEVQGFRCVGGIYTATTWLDK